MFGFSSQIPEEESGMLVNFGNVEEAAGTIEPAKATPPKRVTPPPTPPKPTVTEKAKAQEELNTQDFEEAAAIESAKRKAAEKRKIKEHEKAIERQKEIDHQKEIDRQKAIKAEQKRIEEERIEKERLAQEAKADAIRQQMSNAFGKTNSNSNSQGTGEGTGNQGQENGSINSNGQGLGTSGNWTLAGRSLVGSLPKPKYNLQKEGIVVVEISVDRSGRVNSATPILRGSTTQDTQLWKLAQEAALKANFNANPTAANKQLGTITYHFVLH